MTVNADCQVVGRGMFPGVGISSVEINGILYLAGGDRNRVQKMALRGDKTLRTVERVPAGIQPPNWDMTTAVANVNIAGGNMTPSRSYRVAARFVSTRYDEQPSDLNTPVTVTLGSGDNAISIDETVFFESAENSLEVPDYVDEIWFYRTEANDPETIEDAAVGDFYFVMRVPYQGFVTQTTYAGSTAYTEGDYVQTNATVPVVNPTGALTVRYRAKQDLAAGRSDQATFADDYAYSNNSRWEVVGWTPIYLIKSDDLLEDIHPQGQLYVPPTGRDVEALNGSLCVAGGRSYQMRVNVTNGSKIVEAWGFGGPGFEPFYDGTVGMSFSIGDGGPKYLVERWISGLQIFLDREYDEATAEYELASFNKPRGIIEYSNTDDIIGGAGEPLPDAFAPGTNVIVVDANDSDIEAMMRGREGMFIFTSTSVFWLAGIGLEPIKVMDAAVRTQGKGGIARGVHGEVYFNSDTGIWPLFDITPPQRALSDPIEPMWRPRANTQLYWNPRMMHRMLVHVHPHRRQLIVIGALRGAQNNSTAAVLDLDSETGGWSIYRLWTYNFTLGQPAGFGLDDAFIPQSGPLVEVDITAMATVDMAGRQEVLLAGRMGMDVDEDGVIEEPHFGRIWAWEDLDTFVDEVPRDKNADAIHHAIAQERGMTPITGAMGEKVSVKNVVLHSVPQRAGSIKLNMREQLGHGDYVQRDVILNGDLTKHRNGFSVKSLGRAVVPTIFGITNSRDTVIEVESFHAKGHTLGRGGR